MSTEFIPFQVDTQRVLEVLAKQIYQSPLALLRENTQNAYDAILLRRQLQSDYVPSIEIEILPDRISVKDNGIGMTFDDIRKHFWQAGSSSKNTDEARLAGVVGTFGIGAMANFGIADMLEVETESAITGERTLCRALLENLKFNQDCIETEKLDSQNNPGTKIVARIIPGNKVNVPEATKYVGEFVSMLAIEVLVNGEQISRQPIEKLIPKVSAVWHEERASAMIGSRLSADVIIDVSQNADVGLELNNLVWSGSALKGRFILRSGNPVLRTFRSGFGLANVSVSSIYQFGGIADMLNFQPTAGREALTTDSMQLLQAIMSEIDLFTSIMLSERPECDSSTPFMNWVNSHRRFNLCGNLKISIQPGERTSLNEIARMTAESILPLYGGTDTSVITSYASEDKPLLLLARNNPRRQCEIGYLKEFCKTSDVSDAPQVNKILSFSELSTEQSALAFRIESTLETDYFLVAKVQYGKISHGLALLIEYASDMIKITLDPNGPTVTTILGLYLHEYSAFGSLVKDFVRSAIFPKVADRVPSSTRQGAEAFLRAIRKPREVFEYEETDTVSLSAIWVDYTEGKITLTEAVTRSKETVKNSIQIVEASNAAQVTDVVPDVISNEQAIKQDTLDADLYSLDPAPAITRSEVENPAKLLTIPNDMPDLRGYRCFIALTDKARNDMGDFFLQPHKTSIVWGGQKALFIFLHHSGQFGLYYDLQTRDAVSPESGGKAFPTCTIVIKNRIYIPVPDEIRDSFIPITGSKKKFEVRCDLLRVESNGN